MTIIEIANALEGLKDYLNENGKHELMGLLAQLRALDQTPEKSKILEREVEPMIKKPVSDEDDPKETIPDTDEEFEVKTRIKKEPDPVKPVKKVSHKPKTHKKESK